MSGKVSKKKENLGLVSSQLVLIFILNGVSLRLSYSRLHNIPISGIMGCNDEILYSDWYDEMKKLLLNGEIKDL